MSGQQNWSNAGTSTKAYIVNPRLERQIWWKAQWNMLFGKLNGGRGIKEQVLEGQGGKMVVDVGNDSPIWEKNFTSGGNECRFTTRSPQTGMATYGDASVRTGPYAKYMHSVCFVRQVDSPAYPIVGDESAALVQDVIGDLVELEKDAIALWQAQEGDLDAFRGILQGASRGLLTTDDGGMGVTLYGGSAGAQRSPYNTFVAGQSALTTPSATLATHEATLAALLAGLSDDDTYQFDYEMHLAMLYYLGKLKIQPVRIGKVQYKALCILDQRLWWRLQHVDGKLVDLMKYAAQRGMDNPALSHIDRVVLDDVLYMPAEQLEFFRPTSTGSAITYGCSNDTDPRSDSYSNSSNICMAIYLGAGSLLRGRRSKTWITVETGKHGKGSEYSAHYHDGWMRNDRFSKDGTTSMWNDSSLVAYFYDPGVGTAFAA